MDLVIRSVSVLGNASFFSEEKKEAKKSRLGLSPANHLSSGFLGSYIREVTLLSCAACLAQSQRRLPLSLFMTHASYNLYLFRDSANGRFLFRQVAPAPCSPPLGGSDGNSAVRFTPAVKYGGRENRPSGRETRCMSGHPCRAHHKLKWARKFGRYPPASVQASSTRRERQNNHRRKVPLPYKATPPAKLRNLHPVRQGGAGH